MTEVHGDGQNPTTFPTEQGARESPSSLYNFV